MKASKAMIISVGTGVGGDEAVHSLAQAILGSINAAHPDKVFVVLTPESREKTMPQISPCLQMEWEEVPVADPDDIETIYTSLYPKFQDIRKRYSFLTVDYTSGTKAMTAALVLLGALFEADNITYVGGRRQVVEVLPEEILGRMGVVFAEKRKATLFLGWFFLA